MTIEVKLTPELETRLAAEAEARGLPLEEVAVSLLREGLASGSTTTANLSSEEFHAMLKALAEGSEQLPVLATNDFIRDRSCERRS